MIDASHEHGAETWEQRARVCAAELEEAKKTARFALDLFGDYFEPAIDDSPRKFAAYDTITDYLRKIAKA